jgi:hypothetical protein
MHPARGGGKHSAVTTVWTTRDETFEIRPRFDVPDDAMVALPLDPDAETPRGTIAYPKEFGV